jgi:hypothetical protein
MEGPALGGLVITEESDANQPVYEIGEIADVNGRKHVVVGKTGHYDIEKDRWEVAVKLEAIRGSRIVDEDTVETPTWVTDRIEG